MKNEPSGFSNPGKAIKSGFAAIIGRPNTGKSTLLNCMLHEKIAITSMKPQTTRNKILGIFTDSEYQIVFIDTPGIHTPKSKLGEYMAKAADTAVKDVDCIIFLTAASTGSNIHDGDLKVIEKLKSRAVPVILALNKIDLMPKPGILSEIDKYKNFPFKHIVPVSALKDENVGELISVVKKYIPKGPKYFPGDMITDQPERRIIAEIIREKALLTLQDEIPHGIAVDIMSMKKRETGKDIIDIEAFIYCEKESHKGIIIGKNGQALGRIGKLSRTDIEGYFGSQINLQLWIKVKKDWRDNSYLVKSFGYDMKQI